jgi:hypothetical protein
MLHELASWITRNNAVLIAVLAAVVGALVSGAFRLLVQLLTNICSAIAAWVRKDKQASGLLAATLAEVLHNVRALCALLTACKTALEPGQDDGSPAYALAAKHQLVRWLSAHPLRDAEWLRYSSSDVAAQLCSDALVLLSSCYAAAQDLTAKVRSDMEGPFPVPGFLFEHYAGVARDEIQHSLTFALIFAYRYRHLRRNVIWYELIRALAWYGGSGERFRDVDWSVRQLNPLRKHILKLSRAWQKAGGGLAEDCRVAMYVLSLDPDTGAPCP